MSDTFKRGRNKSTMNLMRYPDHYSGWEGENAWGPNAKKYVKKVTKRACRRFADKLIKEQRDG